MTNTLRDIIAGILALLFVLTFCMIELFDVVNGKSADPPSAILVLVSGVVAFFFGQHATANGAANSQATAAMTAARIAQQTVLTTQAQQQAVDTATAGLAAEHNAPTNKPIP